MANPAGIHKEVLGAQQLDILTLLSHVGWFLSARRCEEAVCAFFIFLLRLGYMVVNNMDSEPE